MNRCKTSPDQSVTRGAAGYEQWFVRLAQECNCLVHQRRVGEDGRFTVVINLRAKSYLVLIHAMFLKIDGDGQMHRTAPAAERQPHRARNKLGDAANVMHHERALAHRTGHAHLVDFLLGAAAQVMSIGASGDGDDRRFAVHGIREPRNGVGEAGSRIHANTRRLGDPAPGIRHMYRRLLMAGVDDAEVLVRHHVKGRQNMITGQAENIAHAFELERFADKVTSRDSRHDRLLARDGQACHIILRLTNEKG